MRRLFAPLVALALACGCSTQRATIVRNVGIGLAAEGALLTTGVYVTRDSDEGITDAVIIGSPLLAIGAAAWILGEIMIGIADPRPVRGFPRSDR